MGKERLSPPRPRRGELFHIAERYLEARSDVSPGASSERTALYGSNFMFGPAALGAVIGGLAVRLRNDRDSHVRFEADRAALAAELTCRDLDSFRSLDELARHILQNEHPSKKR